MKLDSLVPVLYTEDIPATIKFHTTYLDFTCNRYDENWGWASFSNHGVEVMLSRPNAHILFEKSFFTGLFYFRPDDVDALWNNLKDKVPGCYPIENFEYGMRESPSMITTGIFCNLAMRSKPVKNCNGSQVYIMFKQGKA